jgi:hypothetical protein
MEPCNGTGAQSWVLSGASSGVNVLSKLTGANGAQECLDVYTNSNTPGTKVDLAGCNGTTAQVWYPLFVCDWSPSPTGYSCR